MSYAYPTRMRSVAEKLRQRIISGEIQPETRLTEQGLSQELGVSRTPVREALGRLAEERLLDYQPNRGFVVRRFGLKDVNDTCTVRANLEGLACRLIIERRLPAEALTPIYDLVEDQRQVLYGEEWDRQRALLWQELNRDFHVALMDLADNYWLSDAVRRVRHLPMVYAGSWRGHDPEAQVLLFERHHSKQAHAEHVRILKALERNESERAEGLMREHILTNRDVLIEALAEQGAKDVAAAAQPQMREF